MYLLLLCRDSSLEKTMALGMLDINSNIVFFTNKTKEKV